MPTEREGWNKILKAKIADMYKQLSLRLKEKRDLANK